MTTFGRIVFLLAATARLIAPLRASSETIGNPYANGDGRTSTGNTFAFGEVFTVPTDGNDVLEDFSLYLQAAASPLGITGDLYAWNGSGVTGSALYSSSITLPAATSAETAATFSDIGVTLAAGQQYFFVEVPNAANVGIYLKTSGGTTTQGAGYIGLSGGTIAYSGSFAPLNPDFSATFDSAAPAPPVTPASVPDSSSLWWEILAVGLGLGVVHFQRNKLRA